MSGALQVFVRGFGTQAAGQRIVQALENYGLNILVNTTDDNGVIETHICEAAFLDNYGDFGPLRVAVLAVSPAGTVIEHRTYSQDG